MTESPAAASATPAAPHQRQRPSRTPSAAPGTALMLVPRFAPIDLAYALCFGIALRGLAVALESLARGGFVLPGLVRFDGQLAAAQWIWLIVVPVLVSPVIEEWIFRGVLQPLAARGFARAGVQRGTATVVAVVLVAAIFAAGHLALNPGGWPLVTGATTFAVGLACGALAAFTGRLGTAIGVHFVFNATGVGMLLLGTFA